MCGTGAHPLGLVKLDPLSGWPRAWGSMGTSRCAVTDALADKPQADLSRTQTGVILHSLG